jgi:hypothetical protein
MYQVVVQAQQSPLLKMRQEAKLMLVQLLLLLLLPLSGWIVAELSRQMRCLTHA